MPKQYSPAPEDPEFDKWWQFYPRKVQKGDARKAWWQTKSIRPPTPQLINAVIVQRASPDWLRDSGQFVPYPATWLRAEQWDDVQQVEVDAVKDGKAWHESTAGIERMASKLGIEWDARRETFQQFAKRVRDIVDGGNVVSLKAAGAGA